jgi:hypothetical protein
MRTNKKNTTVLEKIDKIVNKLSGEKPAPVVNTGSEGGRKFKVISESPRIKPAQMEPGKPYMGTFRSIQHFINKEKKEVVLVELVPDGERIGFSLYATAMLRRYLEITGEAGQLTSPYLGKYVKVVNPGDSAKVPSAKGQNAWNFIVEIEE